MQEQDDDDNDEDDGFQQGMDDRVDRFMDVFRGVVGDLIRYAFRHGLLQLRHGLVDVLRELQRVGAGGLEDGDTDGVLVVEQ